jgi:hypothetical protein
VPWTGVPERAALSDTAPAQRVHYVDKRNVTSVFGLYLNIERTFWGQPKCRIMGREPMDRSVQVIRSKYIDAPSLEAEYRKNRKTFFFLEPGFF